MQVPPATSPSPRKERRSKAPRQLQILKRHQDYCTEKFFSSHLGQTAHRRRLGRSSKVWHEKIRRKKRKIKKWTE